MVQQRDVNKVMLIKPRNSMAVDSLKRLTTPLGLLYLGATLREKGVEVDILDSTAEGYENESLDGNGYLTYGLSDEQVKERIAQFQPDLVGVTAMFSSQQESALYHCKLTKDVDPEIPTVMGGIHSSLLPIETVSLPEVDYVVINEGEMRFSSLVDILNKGGEMTMDGIAHKSDGEPTYTPAISKIEDLDTLPQPARDMIDMEKYIKVGIPVGPFTRRDRAEQVMTSRGCPLYCNFCTSADYWGRTMRYRSVDNVVEEVEGLIENFGIEEIQWTDDNLTLNKPRVKEIFSRLKPYNLSFCTPNGIMVKTLDEDLITSMAQAGFYQTTFAVESGSERILKEIVHKAVPPKEKVRDLVNMCHDNGVQVHGTLIIGFPGETQEDIDLTMDYPYEVGFDSVSYFLASPLPGSQLYEECRRKGYLKDGPSRYDVKSAEIYIPKDSPDYVMSRHDMMDLVERKTREYNQFQKDAHPDRWEEKFQGFLKRNQSKADSLISGRVT